MLGICEVKRKRYGEESEGVNSNVVCGFVPMLGFELREEFWREMNEVILSMCSEQREVIVKKKVLAKKSLTVIGKGSNGEGGGGKNQIKGG